MKGIVTVVLVNTQKREDWIVIRFYRTLLSFPDMFLRGCTSHEFDVYMLSLQVHFLFENGFMLYCFVPSPAVDLTSHMTSRYHFI